MRDALRTGFLVSGTFAVPPGFEPLEVDTPHGPVTVHLGGEGRAHVLIKRHGDPALPPHLVRHRANIDALARCGVTRVLAAASVGALARDTPIPSLAVPDDLVDFSHHPEVTRHETRVVHVAMEPAFCPHVRRALADAARTHGDGLPMLDGGTYVTTRGPRLETAAEVRHLATLGDIVGMTVGPEATLAREAGLCYAPLALVVNLAAGLGGPLTARDIFAATARLGHAATQVLLHAATGLPPQRECACARALDDAA